MQYFYPAIKEIKSYVSGFPTADIVPKDCIRIMLLNAGNCKYVQNGLSELCFAGNIIIAGEKTAYRMKNKSDDFSCSTLDITLIEGKYKNIEFCAGICEFEYIEQFLRKNTEPVIFNDDSGTHSDFIKLLNIYLANKSFDRGFPIIILLTSIIKNIELQLKNIYDSTKKYSPYVNKAIRYIKSNYAKQISAPDIADYIGVHANYLHKLFTDEVGTTLLEYIQALRISHAKELLRKSDKSIDSIAKDCSFSNVKYFYRVFKKYTNQSPGKYRASYDYTSKYNDGNLYELEKRDIEGPIRIRSNKKS